MESNLVNRRRRLKGQIPDIKSSLIMIDHLREKSAAKEEIESHFLISDQAYSKATIPPTDKVTNSMILTIVYILEKYFSRIISCTLLLLQLKSISGVFMAWSQRHA